MALRSNEYGVLRPAGGSVRSLHQHHAVSALDQQRFRTRLPDEYKNPFQRREFEGYQLNHYTREGAEQLKYDDRLNRAAKRQHAIADDYNRNYLQADQKNEANRLAKEAYEHAQRVQRQQTDYVSTINMRKAAQGLYRACLDNQMKDKMDIKEIHRLQRQHEADWNHSFNRIVLNRRQPLD